MLLFGNLQTLPHRIVAILIAITFHEYAHGWMADRLGDPTPRLRGRLSLNPLVHLDPLGTLLLLLVGFGWAKPVEVNPRNFADWRRGMMIVAVAGPLANITLAFLIGLLFRLQLVDHGTHLGVVADLAIYFNAVLALFNLIPVPPLDGSRILSGLLPPAQALAYQRLAPYGPLLLLLLIMLPSSHFGLILGPPVNWLIRQATGPVRMF
jgi:Zn-dependent protease